METNGSQVENSQLLKAAELGEALRSLGLVLTQKELMEMKLEVGSDLTWEKFKGLVAKKPKAPEKQATI